MSSQLQIIGTKKDPNTRKAQRFFQERGIAFHFVDLTERPIKRGELENIGKIVPPNDLIDPDSREYKQKGFAYMEYDPIEEMLERPLLMKIPVVRWKKRVAVGYTPQAWEEIIRTEM